MPVPPAGHSSSIDSTSSFSSSKSSLLALPLDDVSSQSDIADPKPPAMPRGDTSAYGVAASPSHTTYRGANSPTSGVSATQKLKRAFGKRRRPSQDAATLMSSGDERSASDAGPSSYFPTSAAVTHPSNGRPSAAKLTMHLFGGRKAGQASAADSNQPPPLPPKPTGLRAPVPQSLQVPASIATKLSSNVHGSRPRSSIMATSPSITAAIEFMREDEERQRAVEHQRENVPTQRDHELELNKEDWRKSDSTMASGHTVRPAHPPDSGPGAASKRLSAFLATPHGAGELDFGLDILGGPKTPTAEPEEIRQEPRPVEVSMINIGKQSKRRSLSLNIHVPTRHSPASTPAPAPTSAYTPAQSPLRPPASLAPETYPSPLSSIGSMHNGHSPAHSVSLSSSPRDAPTLTRTPANGIIGSGTANGSPVSKTNIRGRLAAWTAAAAAGPRSASPLPTGSTSSPSLTSPSASSLVQAPHRRVAVTSNASQPSPELQAVAAVRELQGPRMRSPSTTSNSGPAGIRQAATSLTSGAGAMALGLGKRAYEKVGRVWGGSNSGSGSGSDTPSNPYQSPANGNGMPNSSQPASNLNVSYGPSAFPAHSRRTPNAPSGTWSVSSMGGSRSSSEKDPGGRETPPIGSGASGQGAMGKLVRPPRAGASGGVVFGRELWECVRETRAAVTIGGAGGDRLSGRMIPALVFRCAQHLHKWGIEEEGLFRISGRSSHINRLRNEFDSGADYDIIDCSPSELDPHAVASIFKAYLRELPEPILTRSLGPQFDAAMTAESSRAAPVSPSGGLFPKTVGGSGPTLPSGPGAGRALPMIRKPPSLSTFTLPTSSSLRAPSALLIETLGELVARLPRENRDLLHTVVDLMKATAARSKETKMPLSNLLLVFCPSLSMGPTLLRVLCDAPGVWERPPPVVDISRRQVEHEDEEQDVDEESDESDSDSDLLSEDEHIVTLPLRSKGKEREVPIEDSHLEVQTSVPVSQQDVETPSPEESLVSVPPSSRPRPIRRVPAPVLLPDDQQSTRLSPSGNRSFTPPPLTNLLPNSESTPSLEVPSRSLTPSLSPPQSAVSLTSAPGLDSAPMVPPLRTRQFSSPLPSSGFVPPISWAVPNPSIPSPNQNKDLPASPRSPTQPADEERARSTPHLQLPTEMYPERTSSLPASLLLTSHSAPSVVFPSAGSPKATPTTPTSLKKHAMSLSLGQRSPKPPDDEDAPSPSKRLIRRPSLNMLFNMKRSGSPSPRSRTPTISSPISSSVTIGRPMSSVEASPQTVTNLFPPVLSLPIEGTMDVGLGWDDVFGNSLEAVLAPPQPRQTAVSQPSSPPQSPSPPPSPRRPTTEYLLSSGGFFSSSGPPLAMPSATAVLEAAEAGEVGAGAQSSQSDSEPEPAPFQEDSSSGPDSPEVDSPVKEVFTPPHHLSFQLRRSSMEEEDWASAVLMAAGKPVA